MPGAARIGAFAALLAAIFIAAYAAGGAIDPQPDAGAAPAAETERHDGERH